MAAYRQSRNLKTTMTGPRSGVEEFLLGAVVLILTFAVVLARLVA